MLHWTISRGLIMDWNIAEARRGTGNCVRTFGELHQVNASGRHRRQPRNQRKASQEPAKKSPAKKPKKSNEEIFLQHATTDVAFRNALKKGDAEELSSELNRIGLKIAAEDEESVIKAINNIDWSDLKLLEGLLLGQVHPLN